MALFGKFGGGKSGDAQNKRQHTRYEARGETMTMITNGKDITRPFNIKDISEGGLALTDYEGKIKGGQYFEFKLNLTDFPDSPSVTGFANVVRVTETGFLAASFPPQPKLKSTLRKYLG